MVGGGVFDDLMVRQSHDATGFVPLGSTALDSHTCQRSVLPVVLGVASLGWHLMRVLGWLRHIGNLDCMKREVLLSLR